MALVKIASFWKADPGKKAKLRGNANREGVTLPPNAKLQLFENDKGDNPKRPDYTLMLITNDDERGETRREVPVPAGDGFGPDSDDDLPF